MAFLSVSQVARRLNVSPATISWLFYSRRMADDAAPIVGGRRVIDEGLLWLIEAKLIAAGKLPAKREVVQ